jgi:hypothetical protein
MADYFSLATGVAAIVAIGATVYVFSMVALWLIAGRPNGPESDIVGMISNLAMRLQGKKE